MKKKPLTHSMICRKAGLSRSPAKAEAARRNGLKGGRPSVNGKAHVNGLKIKEVKYVIERNKPEYTDSEDVPI